MVKRPFWLEAIQNAWQVKSVVWLTGVRQVGKTTLAQALPDTEFLNCDLPSTQRAARDPERLLADVRRPVVVLDEIHQLDDPSAVLKIGADAFPHMKILATGSSTFAATRKFRDSLTGRKRTLHLPPVLERECTAFGAPDLGSRLLRGGLPEALLSSSQDPAFFAEWLDSYYARDVQELFRVTKRHEFLQLIELLLRQSGGLVEISSLAKHSHLTRPTVQTYLDYLQMTHVIQLLQPFHHGGRQEILRQPKAYAFDTGFVAHCRGWQSLRAEDHGQLWEHVVLDELGTSTARPIHFWRDKLGREVDFVLPASRDAVDAIECKWDAERWSPRSLLAFRALHPAGTNYVVSPQLGRAYQRDVQGTEVTFCNLPQLLKRRANRST